MAERKRTNAEIDILNQFLNEGETPLPYEIADVANPPADTTNTNQNSNEPTEEEKIAAQKILDDAAAEAEKNKTTPPADTPPTNIEVELDDEKVLAYLKNKKGKEVTSIEDLLNPKKEPTEEEKKEAAEKREADKFAFGLSTGKFSKKELEDFITDSKNKTDLVLSQYAALQRQKDPTLSDADIEAEFEEKFSLNEDPESRHYKAGQVILDSLAEKIIKEKYGKILNLESDFVAHETSQSTQKATETRMATQTPLFRKDVEQIRGQIKKGVIQISDTEKYEYELDDKIVDGVIENMLIPDYANGHISNGWDIEKLKTVAQTSGILQSLPKILKDHADKEVLKAQAGTRGVAPDGKESSRKKVEKELTEDQKKALAFAFPEQPAVAN